MLACIKAVALLLLDGTLGCGQSLEWAVIIQSRKEVESDFHVTVPRDLGLQVLMIIFHLEGGKGCFSSA
jgi:hypothetical protein